ncbi:unnamed protein product [Linum tenue]|uniref:Cytochrome c oxidase subunit 3 n=1 Tax=Linum tenue TaxID=586396 RepID=A0AAV0KYA1_9ROSI|nr:unnamed protein product [Linum tenue]
MVWLHQLPNFGVTKCISPPFMAYPTHELLTAAGACHFWHFSFGFAKMRSLFVNSCIMSSHMKAWGGGWVFGFSMLLLYLF